MDAIHVVKNKTFRDNAKQKTLLAEQKLNTVKCFIFNNINFQND